MVTAIRQVIAGGLGGRAQMQAPQLPEGTRGKAIGPPEDAAAPAAQARELRQ
jgi:hypothetical protein